MNPRPCQPGPLREARQLPAALSRRPPSCYPYPACIGTQPAGTLWIGFLATGIGVPAAMALNGAVALLAMLPAAWPLARRGRG